MGFDPFIYWEFKKACDALELAKINAERELIGLPPLMPLSDNLSILCINVSVNIDFDVAPRPLRTVSQMCCHL